MRSVLSLFMVFAMVAVVRAQAVNDLCVDSSPLAIGATENFDLSTSSDSGTLASCGPAASTDVFFAVQAPSAGVLVLETSSPGDIALQVFDACEGTELFCVDSQGGGGSESLATAVSAGDSFVVRLFDDSGQTGSVSANLVGDLTGQHVIIAVEEATAAIDSVQAIRDALVGAEVDPLQIQTLQPIVFQGGSAGLGTPAAVWLQVGTFPATADISEIPGLTGAVRDLVVRGVPLYLSGGDIWGFDSPGALSDVDGVDDIADDGDDSHAGMTGSDIFVGLDNLYTQERAADEDFLDQIVATALDAFGADTAAVWSDDGSGGSAVPYDTGIRYATAPAIVGETDPGNVISTSSEFGGWFEGDDAQQIVAMTTMLDFFGLIDDPAPATPSFVRGDPNGDGTVNLGDVFRLVIFLFFGAGEPDCLDSADINNDAQLTFADVVSLVSFLFLGGDAPTDPFPACAPQDEGEASAGCDAATSACE